MDHPPLPRNAVAAIALLDDPKRRRLYKLVRASRRPVGRDEAAAALGISRELAAFHLDRLVDVGLLVAEYRRLGDRRGPGAGRPAKLYGPAQTDLAVSFPARDYEGAAELFAEAITGLSGRARAKALAKVNEVARARGEAAGAEARRQAGPSPSPGRLGDALVGMLETSGYEPVVDQEHGSLRLGSCPYRALAASNRDLTCHMNLAWAQGVLDGLGDDRLAAELEFPSGYCCVVFEPAPEVGMSDGGDRTPSGEARAD